MPLLCIFSLLTGVGGCSAFLGAVKTGERSYILESPNLADADIQLP